MRALPYKGLAHIMQRELLGDCACGAVLAAVPVYLLPHDLWNRSLEYNASFEVCYCQHSSVQWSRDSLRCLRSFLSKKRCPYSARKLTSFRIRSFK